MIEGKREARQSLLFRAGAYLCSLPLQHVIETMRPLPVEPFAGAPVSVLGVSLIRGEALPVVDMAILLGTESARATRFVTVRVDERRLALCVDAVIGIHTIDYNSQQLAPLLDNVSTEMIDGIAAHDGKLLIILDNARLVPESIWPQIDLAESERASVASS